MHGRKEIQNTIVKKNINSNAAKKKQKHVESGFYEHI
jgi:hypothetical protein